MTLAEQIAALREKIRTLERNAGWNDAGMLDRYWKKDVTAAKKQLRELIKSQSQESKS